MHDKPLPDKPLLGGLRVLDLSQYIPGPFATRQLADLGADVIKVEPPQGDPMRHFMLPGENAEPSPIYRHLNRGKRVVRLNLKSDEGRGRLNQLLTEADVLMESFRPGTLDRLGFDRDTLQATNPRLVHCALSGFGQNGPYRLRAGHDLGYCAASGSLAANGSADRPLMSYPPMADHAGAMQATSAILAALFARERDGKGRYLDISLFESALSWQYLPILSKADSRADDLINGGAACYNIYACADGRFVTLGALEKVFWVRFCETVHRPDWIERQQEAMPQESLMGEIQAMFSSRPQAQWVDTFADVDCCFEPLILPVELDQQAQVQARQALAADGPAYAGQIDDAAVVTADHYVEINAETDIDWQ